MTPPKRRCEQCPKRFVPKARGRRQRFYRPACRKAAARDRRVRHVLRVFKPTSRCRYCRQPLPKERTRRRRYCTPSCRQMAYLRRKWQDHGDMSALIADLKARQRRAAIAEEMARQVDQALGEG
jgi:hypothetical protein